MLCLFVSDFIIMNPLGSERNQLSLSDFHSQIDSGDLWKCVKQLIPTNMRFPVGNYKCYSCDRHMSLLSDWEDHIFKFLKGEGCYSYQSRKFKELRCNGGWYIYKKGDFYHSAICVYKNKARKWSKIHILNEHFKFLFKCAICPKTVTFKFIQEHLSSHDRTTQKYKCSYCSHQSLSEPQRQRHELTHVKNKPFSCLYCDRTFRRKANADEHTLRVHTRPGSDKSVCCPRCRYRTNITANLNKHIKRMHRFVKDQRYECHYCFYKTSIKSDLVSHICRHMKKTKIERLVRHAETRHKALPKKKQKKL